MLRKIRTSYLFLLFSLLLASVSAAQTPDPWFRFRDTSSLYGYKDLQGNIKVPAIFSEFPMSPDTFYNIIPVSENRKKYYLLRNGKQVGLDSVYLFEWNYDCEQEGKIIFKDHKLDRVGFLDKNGQPIIPAIYNYAYPFRNGMAVVGYGATRKCWDEAENLADCEHYGWTGGAKYVINEKNEILIDSLELGYRNLNWYSLKVNLENPDTNSYYTLIGRHGITYSFVDYNKEFKQWFYKEFIPSLGYGGNVRDHLFEEIVICTDGKKRRRHTKNDFLALFPSALTPERFQSNEIKIVSPRQTSFNYFIFDTPIFRKFYNACEFQNDKFPVYEVEINFKKLRLPPPIPDKEGRVRSLYTYDYHAGFEFLRTEYGYKLISASFRE